MIAKKNNIILSLLLFCPPLVVGAFRSRRVHGDYRPKANLSKIQALSQVDFLREICILIL